jgi:hypothetical protein
MCVCVAHNTTSTWNFVDFTIFIFIVNLITCIRTKVQVPMAANNIPISNCVRATDPLY